MPHKKSKLTKKQNKRKKDKVSSLVDLTMKESNELSKEIHKTIKRYSTKKRNKKLSKKINSLTKKEKEKYKKQIRKRTKRVKSGLSIRERLPAPRVFWSDFGKVMVGFVIGDIVGHASAEDMRKTNE